MVINRRTLLKAASGCTISAAFVDFFTLELAKNIHDSTSHKEIYLWDHRDLQHRSLTGLLRYLRGVQVDPASDQGIAYASKLFTELEAIERAGTTNAFILVDDVLKGARRRGFSTSTAGLAGTSLVCLALDISPVDPIKYSLSSSTFIERPCFFVYIDRGTMRMMADELILNYKYFDKAKWSTCRRHFAMTADLGNMEYLLGNYKFGLQPYVGSIEFTETEDQKNITSSSFIDLFDRQAQIIETERLRRRTSECDKYKCPMEVQHYIHDDLVDGQLLFREDVIAAIERVTGLSTYLAESIRTSLIRKRPAARSTITAHAIVNGVPLMHAETLGYFFEQSVMTARSKAHELALSIRDDRIHRHSQEYVDA